MKVLKFLVDEVLLGAYKTSADPNIGLNLVENKGDLQLASRIWLIVNTSLERAISMSTFAFDNYLRSTGDWHY